MPSEPPPEPPEPPEPPARPQRVALVTGASSGVGLELALALAQAGVRIVLVSRPGERAQRALQLVQEAAADAKAAGHLAADLSDFGEVRRLAARIALQEQRLDLLILNAGAYHGGLQRTASGLERTLALNHLAPFLLTHLLTPQLRGAEAPRLVVTTSGAHVMGGRLDPMRMATGTPYSGWRAYGWTKLANLLFVREALRRTPLRDLRAYAFHPGLVRSRLGAEEGMAGWPLRVTMALFGGSAAVGADTGAWLATARPAPEPNGGYFVRRKARTPSAVAQDDQAAADLWGWSESWVDLEPELRWPAPRTGG